MFHACVHINPSTTQSRITKSESDEESDNTFIIDDLFIDNLLSESIRMKKKIKSLRNLVTEIEEQHRIEEERYHSEYKEKIENLESQLSELEAQHFFEINSIKETYYIETTNMQSNFKDREEQYRLLKENFFRLKSDMEKLQLLYSQQQVQLQNVFNTEVQSEKLYITDGSSLSSIDCEQELLKMNLADLEAKYFRYNENSEQSNDALKFYKEKVTDLQSEISALLEKQEDERQKLMIIESNKTKELCSQCKELHKMYEDVVCLLVDARDEIIILNDRQNDLLQLRSNVEDEMIKILHENRELRNLITKFNN